MDGGDDEARRFSRPPPRSVQLRSFEANLSSEQHKSCLLLCLGPESIEKINTFCAILLYAHNLHNFLVLLRSVQQII